MHYSPTPPCGSGRWLIGLSLAALVSTTVTWASRADEEPKAGADDSPAALTVVGALEDALFGKPVEGAKLTITKLDKPRAEGGKGIERIEAVTDEEGNYKFQLPTDRPWKVTTNEQGAPARQNFDAFPVEIEIRHPDYASFRTALSIRLDQQQQPIASPLGGVSGAPVANGRIIEVTPLRMRSEGFGQPATPEDPHVRLLSTLELRPAKEVTGVLQSPEGTPIAGVRVFAHSQAPRNERETVVAATSARGRSGGGPGGGGFGSSRGTVTRVIAARYAQTEDESISDAQGRFRVSMITPGEGMIWIYPDKEFAPQIKVLYDARGDLGTIKLVRGTPVTGRVLDVDGKPLAGVFVSAVPWIATQPKYSSNIIEQRMHRSAESDAQGNFTLGPLPPGDYRVEPKEYLDEITIDRGIDSRREVPGLFVPQKLALKPGQDRAAVDLRAAPTVTIDGRILIGGQLAFPDAQQLHEAVTLNQLTLPTIEGTIGGLPYRQTLKVDIQGSFSALVPKGLGEAVLEMYPQNNSQPQWRLGAAGHLQTTSRIRLGTLEKDFRDLQIVYPRRQAAGEAVLGARPGAIMEGDAVQPQQAAQGGGVGRGGFGGGRGGFGGGFGGGIPQPGEGNPDGGPE